MKDEDRDVPMELTAYGIFRQDFFAVAKQYGKYVLHRMIPVPDCGFCSEQAVKKHIREFEKDACSEQYVFERQEDCFSRLFFHLGNPAEDRKRMAAEESASFTDEELLMLSRGLLSLIRGTEQALELADYDHGMHFAALKAMERYKKLNDKVCSAVSRSSE
ncbi:MAG: hypothetical protein HFH85_20890 [Lachnospiraceae bacterium]|jgi:hypothetical protein|nr:hypothetical protein [Lachnospiraceae bacterium]HBA48549.1 hypothetical protein [Lachnospiraceae bacterium]